MQNIIKGLALTIIAFSCQALFAQQVKINLTGPPPPQYPPATVLPVEQREQVIKSVEATLNQYAKAATLMDETKKKVTSESIARFSELFNPNAELVKDYVEFVPAELVGVKEYCAGVFNRLDRHGVQVKTGNATLLSIADDPTGFYVVTVKVEKIIYNYVNENQDEKISAGGKMFKQEFRFDVPKKDLNKARIAKIRQAQKAGKEGKIAGEPDDYAQYWGPSIGVSKPFVSPSFSNLWASEHAANSTMDVSGEASFSGGFDFLTNHLSPRSAEHKNLFVSVGLHFNYIRLKTTLSDFAIAEFNETAVDENGGDKKIDYLRSVAALSAEEKINIGIVQIPLGIGLRLKKSVKSDIFLNAKLIPAFSILSTGSLSGKGTYDASVDCWRALREGAVNPDQLDNPDRFGPFFAGSEAPLEGSPDPKTAGFSLAAQVSPNIYFHLSDRNPNWSLLLGLDLTYQFGSLLEHTDGTEEMLRFPEGDYSGSILQHYTTGMSAFSAGLRIGLHHRFTTKP